MKKDNKRHKAAEEDFMPNIAQSIAPFLIGLAAALFGDTALYLRWFPAGFLCFAIFLICVVRIVILQQRKEKAEYRMWRRVNGGLDKVETFEGRFDILETNLDLKADKPARSNIRPGSRQSDLYKEMTGGGD